MVYGSLISIVAIVCAIWVIYDVWVVNKKKTDDAMKILWTIFAILFSIITAIIYYLFVKKR